MGIREITNLPFPEVTKSALTDKGVAEALSKAFKDWDKFVSVLKSCKDDYDRSSKSLSGLMDALYAAQGFSDKDPKAAKALEKLNKEVSTLYRAMKSL